MTGGDGKLLDLATLAGALRGNRRVVLVGPPGIGKSVACLCLVRELLASGSGPVPVVLAALDLPRATGEPMADRWCDEITRRYQTSRAQAMAWLESGQLLPVIDGLDALSQADQTACIGAINVIRPCLITCRAGAYEMLAAKFGPHDLVRIQPLSLSQVERQLPIELDSDLAELLTTPAFLRLALRMPSREVTGPSAVCAELVRQKSTGYAPHLAWNWLSWMAQFPVFDPRNVRVSMLSRRAHRGLARGGAIGVVAICALAVIEGTAWLVAGWWPEPYEGPAMAAALRSITAMVCLAAVTAEARLRRAIVRWLLVAEGALPQDLGRFLHAAHRAGLLDQTRDGYRFVHRQLRRYFLADAHRRIGRIA
ncbi:hypothetical protein [Rhizocola hellebori]|nr:hypothetical protein [Rhizocola hellebori]